MNREQFTASAAPVLAILLLNKGVAPFFSDIFQVFYYTHFINVFVPLFHALDLFAGILAAFETKNSFSLGSVVDSRAFGKQVGARAVPRPTACTLTAFDIVPESQVMAANSAIHSAWGNQFVSNWIGRINILIRHVAIFLKKRSYNFKTHNLNILVFICNCVNQAKNEYQTTPPDIGMQAGQSHFRFCWIE